MIELLIKYIQDKGYNVRPLPQALYIWKIINGQRLNLIWAISKVELASLDWDTLTYAADRNLREFTYAEHAALRGK